MKADVLTNVPGHTISLVIEFESLKDEAECYNSIKKWLCEVRDNINEQEFELAPKEEKQ